MLSINNSVIHTLSWDAPFTWPDFPIISYVVNITNLSNRVTNLTVIHHNDSHKVIHQFTSQGDSCYEIEISVVANNTVGDSKPAVLSVGHPISTLLLQ